MLREIDADSIAPLPVFVAPTPWHDLHGVRPPAFALSAKDYIADTLMTGHDGVRVLDARWPPGCCVCGKEPTRPLTVRQRFVYTPPGVGRVRRDREIEVVAKDVPHCAAHEGGVSFETHMPGTPPRERSLGLLFRSYGYRNAFLRLNPREWSR